MSRILNIDIMADFGLPSDIIPIFKVKQPIMKI